ncbi:MAG: hypothetical protein QOD77_925 [Thermoplasmata archaeon]|jgi:Cu+-exporting ATPase|nr:hypothetical protein [Thermoplasmata archaeon]
MGILDMFRGKKAAASQDPVCHMQVTPAKAAGTATHGGTTYLFCSAGCKAKFENDPHAYLGAHAH